MDFSKFYFWGIGENIFITICCRSFAFRVDKLLRIESGKFSELLTKIKRKIHSRIV
jgi:hypothetical protein